MNKNPTPIKWGNVTVPYTAMWAGEADRRQPKAVRERWGKHSIWMLSESVSAPGDGKPLFKMLHADRCRQVIKRGLCQMCLSMLPAQVVTVNQGQRDGFNPLISDGLPMCPRCALEALESCPGMQRQEEQGALRMWLSLYDRWLIAPVALGEVPASKGGDERLNALLRSWPDPIFTGPKLVVLGAQRIRPEDLRRTVEKARAA